MWLAAPAGGLLGVDLALGLAAGRAEDAAADAAVVLAAHRAEGLGAARAGLGLAVRHKVVDAAVPLLASGRAGAAHTRGRADAVDAGRADDAADGGLADGGAADLVVHGRRRVSDRVLLHKPRLVERLASGWGRGDDGTGVDDGDDGKRMLFLVKEDNMIQKQGIAVIRGVR